MKGGDVSLFNSGAKEKDTPWMTVHVCAFQTKLAVRQVML